MARPSRGFCRRDAVGSRRQEADFETLLPTDVEKEAFGYDLLNYSKMRLAIEAGKSRAKSETTRLRELIPRVMARVKSDCSARVA